MGKGRPVLCITADREHGSLLRIKFFSKGKEIFSQRRAIRELQLHAALRHPGKRREGTCGQLYDGQVSEAFEILTDQIPPHTDAVAAKGVNEYLSRVSAGPADAFFNRLAHIDPDPDCARSFCQSEGSLSFPMLLPKTSASSARRAKVKSRTIMRSSFSEGWRATVKL
jgi:hypothetical protein